MQSPVWICTWDSDSFVTDTPGAHVPLGRQGRTEVSVGISAQPRPRCRVVDAPPSPAEPQPLGYKMGFIIYTRFCREGSGASPRRALRGSRAGRQRRLLWSLLPVQPEDLGPPTLCSGGPAERPPPPAPRRALSQDSRNSADCSVTQS